MRARLGITSCLDRAPLRFAPLDSSARYACGQRSLRSFNPIAPSAHPAAFSRPGLLLALLEVRAGGFFLPG